MPSTSSRYGVPPSVGMIRQWINTLPEKTGRSLDQWLSLIRAEGPNDEAARREWLKTDHKLGSRAAIWLAERAEGRGTEEDSPEAYLHHAELYVANMFAGDKAGLLPVYEALLDVGLGLGADVMACPAKTIVPFYRNHVFAQLKPSTRTRLDLGLALGNMAVPARLIDTGGYAKKDRITYRIPITSVAEIDDEVRHWLKLAYTLDEK
ncbi:DUF5655 domain-containing protein [Chitinimonas sp.]|uniref:DUF5655 domain-containing protein n=1 Tax=Chitinimonas sp. TaxID=1934313 RepID=UPI002F92A137